MWTVSLEKVVSRAAPGGFNAPCNINVLARSLRLASGVYRLRAVACGVMEHHISPASKAQSCPAMPGSASRTPVRASGAACVGRKVGLGERGAREQARVAKYCACMRVRASGCMRALPKHVHAPTRACWPGWSWSTDGRRALERLAEHIACRLEGDKWQQLRRGGRTKTAGRPHTSTKALAARTASAHLGRHRRRRHQKQHAHHEVLR